MFKTNKKIKLNANDNAPQILSSIEPSKVITTADTTTTTTTDTHSIPTKGGLFLSKNMEYILQQEALTKGLDPALLKSNGFSHLIIKGARDDEFMYLSVMVRRLNHCCPYHPEAQEQSLEETVQQKETPFQTISDDSLTKDLHIQSKPKLLPPKVLPALVNSIDSKPSH